METRQTMFSPRLHALWDKNYRKIKQKYWENGEKTLKNNSQSRQLSPSYSLIDIFFNLLNPMSQLTKKQVGKL